MSNFIPKLPYYWAMNISQAHLSKYDELTRAVLTATIATVPIQCAEVLATWRIAPNSSTGIMHELYKNPKILAKGLPSIYGRELCFNTAYWFMRPRLTDALPEQLSFKPFVASLITGSIIAIATTPFDNHAIFKRVDAIKTYTPFRGSTFRVAYISLAIVAMAFTEDYVNTLNHQ